MSIDTSLLSQLLKWLMSAGAGAAAFFIMEKVPELARLPSEAKRYVSIALSAGLAMAAFTAGVGLGYEPTPATAQAWVEALFAVGFVASGLSQVIHGRAKLARR